MGPLQDVTILELGGIGPVPFCGMVFADLGARVIRIDRIDEVGSGPRRTEPLLRGRSSVAVDLKHPAGVETVLRLVAHSDALIEGFRPGTTERLGVGPEECLATNPRLVYGRMTGWGQEGPLAQAAGHDINFIALTGILGMIGPAEAPAVPLNLVGDFGGGGMLLAVGVLAALLEAERSGSGQVIDAAMVDGAALLSTMVHGFRAGGLWTDERAANVLDGGAPFYAAYRTADGGFVSIGAIEPQFFRELIDRLGLSGVPDQYDRARWPELRARLAETFAGRELSHWVDVLEGTDACFAPVLSADDAPAHPHLSQRGTFVEVDGVRQPAPAPRFSRTGLGAPVSPAAAGRDTEAVLGAAGFSTSEVDRLREDGAIA
ncbi:MAG: CoA transferase [Acidimicrobiia bacterium]|nr:CoA transferase [Acidimicrobiia bacterium]